jgi:predicted negative regulator of RcsB-dependent stress response
VVIGVAVLVAVVALYFLGTYFFRFREERAEKAFAGAFEKYNAQVQDASPIATQAPSTGKTYTDEPTKWKETAEAFEQLASDYSGYYGTIGKYYAGVAYLHLDDSRDKGTQLLQQAADRNDGRTSDLARLAVAEDAAAHGEIDKALDVYEKLQASSYLLKPAVQFALGRLYEQKGDKARAADLYFEAAKTDRMTGAGSDAEKRLKAIAPDRVKDLPPSTSSFTP